MELREPAPPSVFSPQEFFQAEDFSGAQPIYTRGFTLSTEKHFKRKQGVLARLVGSLNFLITEDTGTREMRACPRLEFRAEVTYVSQKGTTGTGFLVDISKTGLQLETERKLPKGITLALNAPDRDEVEENIPFMARVKWTRKVGDKFRAGLWTTNTGWKFFWKNWVIVKRTPRTRKRPFQRRNRLHRDPNG